MIGEQEGALAEEEPEEEDRETRDARIVRLLRERGREKLKWEVPELLDALYRDWRSRTPDVACPSFWRPADLLKPGERAGLLSLRGKWACFEAEEVEKDAEHEDGEFADRFVRVLQAIDDHYGGDEADLRWSKGLFWLRFRKEWLRICGEQAPFDEDRFVKVGVDLGLLSAEGDVVRLVREEEEEEEEAEEAVPAPRATNEQSGDPDVWETPLEWAGRITRVLCAVDVLDGLRWREADLWERFCEEWARLVGGPVSLRGPHHLSETGVTAGILSCEDGLLRFVWETGVGQVAPLAPEQEEQVRRVLLHVRKREGGKWATFSPWHVWNSFLREWGALCTGKPPLRNARHLATVGTALGILRAEGQALAFCPPGDEATEASPPNVFPPDVLRRFLDERRMLVGGNVLFRRHVDLARVFALFYQDRVGSLHELPLSWPSRLPIELSASGVVRSHDDYLLWREEPTRPCLARALEARVELWLWYLWRRGEPLCATERWLAWARGSFLTFLVERDGEPSDTPDRDVWRLALRKAGCVVLLPEGISWDRGAAERRWGVPRAPSVEAQALPGHVGRVVLAHAKVRALVAERLPVAQESWEKTRDRYAAGLADAYELVCEAMGIRLPLPASPSSDPSSSESDPT